MDFAKLATISIRLGIVTFFLGMVILGLLPGMANGDPCVLPDNGSGTVNLPPEGCPYLTADEVHMIVEGLPPNTTIIVAPIHGEFHQVSRSPGGIFGGEIEIFQSILQLQLTGTGDLSGFNRMIVAPVACEVHTGPRTLGDPVQTFPSEMMRLQGEIFGDPDFDYLGITAGTDFGFPSPGQTTLTQIPGGNFNVDSFFDLEYQIEFVGAPGSVLGGMGGTTTGQANMGAGEPLLPPGCVVPDNGTGTVNLPPEDCQYLSPDEVHLIIDGLPTGTTIELDPIHDRFFVVETFPGGSLGGEVEIFDSIVTFNLTGTGELEGFQRLIQMPVACEVHTGPRNAGDPVQTFPNDMFRLQGQIFGDPDFLQLIVTAGTDFGLPSPGQTTLTQIPGGDFNVDSFFDITYRIDFVGAPGSILEGMGGVTVATVPMGTGAAPTSGIEDKSGLRGKTDRIQSHPNPFYPTTMVSFAIETSGTVDLQILDVTGRMVRNLVNSRLSAGEHQVIWDGRDDNGSSLESGTYFYQLQVDGSVVGSKRALLLK